MAYAPMSGNHNAGFIYFQVYDIFKYRDGKRHTLRKLRWYSPAKMSGVECSMSGLNQDWEYFEMSDDDVERHILMESI